MKRLFIDYTPEGEILLEGEQARHISKSLRMKTGDMLMVSDNRKTDYGCIIDEIGKNSVHLKVCYTQASKSEPSCAVTIYQGVPKGSKFEDVIQKCTELGAVKFVPVLTKRSVSRPDEKSAAKKTSRYRKIALEAAQQSGRGIIPEVSEMTTLKNAVAQDDSDIKIVFYEGGGEPVKNIVKNSAKTVSVYIGPEGGFEKEEVEEIESAGAVRATLGPRILRTQTAPVAALCAIMLLTGNLE